MILAELSYPAHYADEHGPLVELLGKHFGALQHGLQGDSWVWIFEGESKVAVDTFSSMKHQVKSNAASLALAQRVITVLATRYTLEAYDEPELEVDDES